MIIDWQAYQLLWPSHNGELPIKRSDITGLLLQEHFPISGLFPSSMGLGKDLP